MMSDWEMGIKSKSDWREIVICIQENIENIELLDELNENTHPKEITYILKSIKSAVNPINRPVVKDKIFDKIKERTGVNKAALNEMWGAILEDDQDNRELTETIQEREKRESEIAAYQPQAVEFLKTEDKFKMIKEILDYNIINEDTNKMLTFMLITAGYFERHQLILFIGQSSSGKSYIAQNVLKLFPKSDYNMITGGSDKALMYQNFDGVKTLFIDEVQRNPNLVELIKDFRPGADGITYWVTEKNSRDEFKTAEKKIPMMTIIGTTTKDNINDELKNGAWLFEPQQSKPQNKAVVRQKLDRSKYKFKINQNQPEIDRKIKIVKAALAELQKHYNKCDVVVPFSNTLEKLVIFRFGKIRRDISKLISLIEIISIWNSKIRESIIVNEKKYVLAHPNDLFVFLEYGVDAFLNITQNISNEKQRILDVIGYLGTIRNIEWYNTNDIYNQFTEREGYSKTKKSFRNILNDMVDFGHLEKQKDGRTNTYKKACSGTFTTLTKDQLIQLYNDAVNEYNAYKVQLRLGKHEIEEKQIEVKNIEEISIFDNEKYKQSKEGEIIDRIIKRRKTNIPENTENKTQTTAPSTQLNPFSLKNECEKKFLDYLNKNDGICTYTEFETYFREKEGMMRLEINEDFKEFAKRNEGLIEYDSDFDNGKGLISLI